MFLKSRIKFLVLFLFVFISFSTNAADEWLADELLKQLQEIRKEVKAMRGDIADLRDEIKHLQPMVAQEGKPIKQVSANIGSAPILGDKNAKIAIIEYSDFQCPFCTRHNKQTLPQIQDSYIKTGQVKYVMKDFPLSFHQKAKVAAVAARCAGEQGQYEAMRNLLFNNARKLNREFYLEKAKSLMLDETKYKACLDNKDNLQQVDADINEGTTLGVTGTPAFFVGKVKDGKLIDAVPISGAVPFARFQQVIDSLKI